MRKLINNFKILLDDNKSVLKYSKGAYTKKNIGDALNIFLFEKIFEKEVVNYREILNTGIPPVYSFIGSVLDNSAVRNLTVMGSGFKKEISKLPVIPRKAIACRGPLTRKKLLHSGMKRVEDVYGDPAILLPRYFDLETEKKFRMGLIPHYTDKNLPIIEKWAEKNDVKLIDVFSSMEIFVEDIKSCDFTISSSLHGVILSHSYGVPSTWVKLSNNIIGGDFKFQDYFLSVGKKVEPITLENGSTLSKLKTACFLPDMYDITNKLEERLNNFEIK
ncbi:polysaccharide pyruvyl transferase family protein [Salinimicrobium sp. TIG7-5_MAKvit]|uniref:polysaccharide pyruvyl transferase family protein n=1 Tax=Salinimicrobium sp. TIG7-5_MAKvit TaxID=3121289 RepID=UPI003C6E1336